MAFIGRVRGVLGYSKVRNRNIRTLTSRMICALINKSKEGGREIPRMPVYGIVLIAFNSILIYSS